MKKFLAFLLTFALLLVPFSTVSFAADAYTDVTLTGISGWDTWYDDANSRWVLYLTTDGFVSPATSGDEAWAWKYEGLTIEYDGEEFKTNQVSSADGNRLYCTIPSSAVPAINGVSFTVKAGQYEPDDAGTTAGLNILNDFDIVTVDYRLVHTKVIYANVEAFDGNANSFYFSLKDADVNPINAATESWSNFLVPAYCDGTRIRSDGWTNTYSGVFVNGDPINYEAAHFKYVNTGTFYIGGLNAVEGTTVTVKGNFVSARGDNWDAFEGNFFLKELTFTYSDGVWTATKSAVPYKKVDLLSSIDTSNNGENWVVYLTTNGYQSINWAHKYENFTIECNGVTATTVEVSSVDNNKLYCTIPSSAVPATNGTVVTIKAGKYAPTTANTLHGLSITEDFEMVVVDGHLVHTKVLDDTNVEAFDGNANSFYFSLKDADGNSIKAAVESWSNFLVPANCDGTRIGSDGWTNTYSGVFVNGDPINYEAAHFKYVNTGTFYIGGLNAVEGTTVTVKGNFVSARGDNWDAFEGNFFLNELTFKFDGSAWALQREVTYTEHTGTPVFDSEDIRDGVLKGIYFSAGETEFPYFTDWSKNVVAADDEESGVFLNGEKTPVFLKKVNEDLWYVCLSDAGVVAVDSDEITILGSFIYGTDRITFNEYTYVYEAPKEPEVGNTYTGTPVLTTDGECGNADGFYFAAGDNAPFEDWTLTYYSVDGDANGVFLNGTKTAITLKKIQANLWYVCIKDAQVTLNTGDVLTIKGDFVTEDRLNTITFAETSFEYNGKSFYQGDFAVTDFTITGLAYSDIVYDTVNSQWNMYFTLSNNIPGDIDSTYYPYLTYEIDGVEHKAHWFKSSSAHKVGEETIYNLYIPIKELPETLDEEYVVTIKANTAQGRQQGTNVPLTEGIRLTEDYQFVVGSNYTAVAPLVDTVNNGGNENGIFITTVDNFPVIGWDYSLTKVGTESGVYVNGENTNVFLKKHGVNQYYICLSDLGITAQEGTIVMLKGTFTTANLNFVKFQTAKYIYTDGQWKTYSIVVEEPSTGVPGDANGDNKFDVLDLIRMKKFTLGEAENINIVDADLNADGIINASDLALAIKLKLKLVTFEEGSNITGVPTYTDDAEMRLAAYVSPTVDEGFDDYKAAGFTTLISENRAEYDAGNATKLNDLDAYMTLAEKNGLDVLVQAGHLQSMLVGKAACDPTWLKEMNDYLSKHNNYRGLFMGDEPRINQLQSYTEVVNAFKLINPDVDLFTSCLPTYTNEEYLWSGNNLSLAEKYSNYTNAFGNLFGEFTYDFYPFKHGYSSFLGIKYDEKDYMRSDWFHNLSLAATNAKGAFDTGITVQSYSENLNAKDHYRDVTEADVSFQVYTALAYGMKSINYFTYGTHWDPSVGTTSCMIYNGNKTDVYYAVQNVNNEIKKFDHVLLNFNWQGTIGIVGDNSDKMMDYVDAYTSKRISAYSATNDAIIGCLKDSKGYDGFMLVNATDPSDNLSEEISVTFKNADHAKVYINGQESIVELSDGTYNATLAPGQGIFVIPYIA